MVPRRFQLEVTCFPEVRGWEKLVWIFLTGESTNLMSLHEKGLCVARSLISEAIAVSEPLEYFKLFCAYFEDSASERGMGIKFCVGSWESRSGTQCWMLARSSFGV